MLVLGIESTAHTLGVAVVDAPGARVLSNVRRLHAPETGGIHPRVAADHHAEAAAEALREALLEARLSGSEIEAIAYSRAPGLGPCLRVGATVARTLSLQWNVPLVAVNHCIAHVEIGRAACRADDPVVLYASGGNTQVITYLRGRYRVIGETLDIGVGNLLDKVARHLGHPFPGGPALERLARAGEPTVALPYSVRGMDVALSGLQTAAIARLKDNRPEDVAASLQETVFAMLAEVVERAVCLTDKSAVVLAGGVACNQRLQAMLQEVGKDLGVAVGAPPPELLVDNGAMIAHTGWLHLQHDGPTPIGDSRIEQGQRTDDVPVAWRSEPPWAARRDASRGAEARLTETTHVGRDSVRKHRPSKPYRHALLDARLRRERTRAEARALQRARVAGVRVPAVLDADADEGDLVLERLAAPALRDINEIPPAALTALAAEVTGLHHAGIAHGDLTLANVLWDGTNAWLVDFGLASLDAPARVQAADLHVLEEDLAAERASPEPLWAAFNDAYAGPPAVLPELHRIRTLGRYRGT